MPQGFEVQPTMQEHVTQLIETIREPLALDRWAIYPQVGSIADSRAYCSASPEYREATIGVDLEKLKTGDDLAEMIVHEMTHPHVWPLHAVAEELANALAESAPDHLREPLRKLVLEQVRKAAETVTTDVGQTYLRLLRRASILDTPTDLT